MKGGIIFLKTQKFQELLEFYLALGFAKWLSQPEIEILKYGNLLIGIQKPKGRSTCGLLTIFVSSKGEVDAYYKKLKQLATTEPRENSKYQIYNFFAKDIEGRQIEVQTFLHDLPAI